MKTFNLALVALFLSGTAMGAVRPFYQDVRLPTQKMVEAQQIVDPAAAGTTNILSNHAGNTSSAAVVVSSFVAQPDVPRNIVITPGGTIASVAACTVTVAGTNFFGTAITETFDFANDSATAATGVKAFKSITSVTFPLNCEDGAFAATWSIGFGEKIGLKRCLNNAGDELFSTVAGAYESTRATIHAANDTVEGNTADFNGTMNGSNDFEIFFFQNFRCMP